MYLFVKIEKYIILAAFKWKVLYFCLDLKEQ